MPSQDGYSTSRSHYPPFGGREVDADGTLYDVVEWRKTFTPGPHYRIHQGEAFSAYHNNGNLASGSYINVEMRTGDIPPHIIMDVSGKFDYDLDILEEPTSSGGNLLDSYNRSRYNTLTPGTTLLSDSTITNDGTIIFSDFMSQGQKSGGSLSFHDEWILKPSTKYIFRLTSRDNSNRVHINLTWYEPGLEAPSIDLWTPADLPDLYMWFDASDASTITLSGSDVTQIDDKSGNNYHATQPVVSDAPEWGAALINGLNVLDFNKTNNHMVTGGVAALDRSMAIVAVYPTGSATRVPTGVRDSANERSYIGQNGLKSRFAAAEVGNIDGDSLLGNTTNVQVGYHNTAKVMRHYLNGTQDINTTFTGTIGSVENYYLGNLNDAGSPNNFVVFNGKLAEVVFTSNTISDLNREKLEGYLAHKWGSEGLLPASHPYKSAPPTQSPAVVWTPSSLDNNLKLWLDASDLSTLTVNGSNVTQWDDKSGTGNHVTQLVSSQQFTTGTRTLNSLNVLEATSSKTMQALYDFGDQNNTPTNILGVVGWDTQDTNHSIIDGDVGSNKRILIRRRANNVLSLWTGTFLDDYNTVGIDNILFTATANAANSKLSVNGQSPTTGNTGTNEGLRNKIVVEHADGIWAELLVYAGPMSTDDQQKVEGYFAWKWGGL